MNPPADQKLPFFAYGVFKPGELAFLQIKDMVLSCRSDTTYRGWLLIRDGLPIADLSGNDLIHGDLISFHPGLEEEAYRRIAALEPDTQYRWEVVIGEAGRANILAGRSPKKGSVHPIGDWTGHDDPLFTAALDVVSETLEQNRVFKEDLRPLFRLEMAYLLLWSSIERYASLRYHLGDKATKKVLNLASEPAFQAALLKHVQERREVQRADDPTAKCVLDASAPPKALAFYYQVRSNLVHRGKGVWDDHDRFEKSLDELLKIFRDTLNAAFADSKWPTGTN